MCSEWKHSKYRSQRAGEKVYIEMRLPTQTQVIPMETGLQEPKNGEVWKSRITGEKTHTHYTAKMKAL